MNSRAGSPSGLLSCLHPFFSGPTDSIAPTASGHGGPTCGSRYKKETSSLHQSIATACTRCWRLRTPIVRFPRTPLTTVFPGHCSDPSIVRLPLSAPPIPQMILERMGNSRSPREEGLGVVASRAELRTSPARTQSLKQEVLPQVLAETPVRKRGPKPQSSPGHDPEHVGELCLPPTHPWPLLCRATNVCSSGDLTPGVALTTPQKFAGRAQTPCSNFRRQAGGKGPQGPQGSHPPHPQG